MANYVIQQVGERSWSVLDEGAASWYVIEGEERAAVIDTGITTGAHMREPRSGSACEPNAALTSP